MKYKDNKKHFLANYISQGSVDSF